MTGHELIKGVPALWEEGTDVAKNLLTHGLALEGQLVNASATRRSKLEGALSATALTLYLLQGGGYLPSRADPWKPRP